MPLIKSRKSYQRFDDQEDSSATKGLKKLSSGISSKCIKENLKYKLPGILTKTKCDLNAEQELQKNLKGNTKLQLFDEVQEQKDSDSGSYVSLFNPSDINNVNNKETTHIEPSGNSTENIYASISDDTYSTDNDSTTISEDYLHEGEYTIVNNVNKKLRMSFLKAKKSVYQRISEDDVNSGGNEEYEEVDSIVSSESFISEDIYSTINDFKESSNDFLKDGEYTIVSDVSEKSHMSLEKSKKSLYQRISEDDENSGGIEEHDKVGRIVSTKSHIDKQRFSTRCRSMFDLITNKNFNKNYKENAQQIDHDTFNKIQRPQSTLKCSDFNVNDEKRIIDKDINDKPSYIEYTDGEIYSTISEAIETSKEGHYENSGDNEEYETVDKIVPSEPISKDIHSTINDSTVSCNDYSHDDYTVVDDVSRKFHTSFLKSKKSVYQKIFEDGEHTGDNEKYEKVDRIYYAINDSTASSNLHDDEYTIVNDKNKSHMSPLNANNSIYQRIGEDDENSAGRENCNRIDRIISTESRIDKQRFLTRCRSMFDLISDKNTNKFKESAQQVDHDTLNKIQHPQATLKCSDFSVNDEKGTTNKDINDKLSVIEYTNGEIYSTISEALETTEDDHYESVDVVSSRWVHETIAMLDNVMKGDHAEENIGNESSLNIKTRKGVPSQRRYALDPRSNLSASCFDLRTSVVPNMSAKGSQKLHGSAPYNIEKFIPSNLCRTVDSIQNDSILEINFESPIVNLKNALCTDNEKAPPLPLKEKIRYSVKLSDERSGGIEHSQNSAAIFDEDQNKQLIDSSLYQTPIRSDVHNAQESCDGNTTRSTARSHEV